MHQSQCNKGISTFFSICNGGCLGFFLFFGLFFCFCFFWSSWIVLNGNDHEVNHKQAWRISLSVWNYSTRMKPDPITSFKWLEDFMRVWWRREWGLNVIPVGAVAAPTLKKCCTDSSLALQWFWMELIAVTPHSLYYLHKTAKLTRVIWKMLVCCLPAACVHILADTGCKMVSCSHSQQVERLPQETDLHWWLAVIGIRCWPSSTRPCTQRLRWMLRESWSN